MITQCPACTTMFKVVPDQLRISDGWVRCGQCDEVFDANAHLQQEAQESKSALQEPSSHVEAEAGSAQKVTTSQSLQDAVSTDPTLLNDAALESEPHLDVQDVSLGGAAARTDGLQDNATGAASFDVELERAVDVDHAADAFLNLSPQELLIDPLDIAPGDDLEPAPRFVQAAAPARSEEQDIKLSFLRQDVSPTQGGSRKSRWVWAGLGVVLSLGLAVQWVVFERDRIVASEPVLRPGVEAVCRVMGCIVGPLRQIESIVIDSSAFTKVGGDLYRLSFVLKSGASFELAAPSMELSITDSQDQPLVRRVLQPVELGNKSATLAPNGEWNVSVSIGVKQAAGAERIAGYRLLAFYP